MKFTNGYWLCKDGIVPNFAQQAIDPVAKDDTLTVYAPTRPVHARGNMLDTPLLTVSYSSPMRNVIKVRLSHFEGTVDNGPHFVLNGDGAYTGTATNGAPCAGKGGTYTGGTCTDSATACTDSAACGDKVAVYAAAASGDKVAVYADGAPEASTGNCCDFEHAAPTALITEHEAVLQSGELSVHVALDGTWNVSWQAAGRELTKSGNRSAGFMAETRNPIQYLYRSDETVYIKDELSLGVGENVYGLGERFGAFIKNGQTVDIWNEDGGTASDKTYKNIPFYLTNKGYGVFVANSGAVSFEVATEKVSRVQFSVPGEMLEYFVIYGETPKSILERYTALTGRPAVLPEWSYGLWLSTSFTTSYDEKTVMSFIDGMKERNIPLSVFHFDCFWMRGWHWCDFLWDNETFPDPKGLLARLHDRGLKVCVWINPYISQRSVLFAEGVANGYFIKKHNGDVYQTDSWQPGMAIVDFTNPNACKWYSAQLERLVDMGVDAFKTDFGERIPLDAVYFDKSDAVRMHNFYTYLYNQTVFELLEHKKGKGRACLFARSATAGCQKFPLHWGGDCESTFESMAESLRGGLSLGLCGFGYWSHDIGGFEGTPDPKLFKRWLAFGLLSSHSRLHGSKSYRVPWLIDEEAADVARAFAKIKGGLIPYLVECGNQAAQTGVPILRAMFLEFPDDPVCAFLDRQYMLGGSYLVAPVLSADDTVEYYVPLGTWKHVIDGRTLDCSGGGTWLKETYDVFSLPLWQKV